MKDLRKVHDSMVTEGVVDLKKSEGERRSVKEERGENIVVIRTKRKRKCERER